MAGSNFVDYVKIFARSGHGGSGSAHFRREKFVEFGGPDGGDGGRGGHIILRGDSQYWTLIHLKYQRHQFAEDGEGGSGARSSGKNGKDIVIPVPLGTVARRVLEDGTTEYAGEVTADGEELVLLKGGRGGLGNWHFKTSTNQAPRYAQPGEDRQEGTFILELKVLADVGLVGFPNAGKSTLLSVVSAAKPKIANYAFTTLEPNLGIVECRDHHSFVMADIPGIIEGAHEGKGLGTRFLRHIERNSVLLFMIPADSDDIRKDYAVLLGELTQYNPELLDKERLDRQEGTFILELKVLADVGLVGFPNAGKSTLLSVVSAAKPKIANYAFTTLEPNLGIVECRDHHSFVMADIPGIIEGAHEGKGLGTRFLRHIERNSVLLFMIPADSDDIRKDYAVLLGELTQYNPELLDKERLLAITKCDMLDEDLIEEMKSHLPEGVPSVFISSISGMNIPRLKDMLWEALQK